MKDPITNQQAAEDGWKHTTLKSKSKFYPKHLISKEIVTFENMVLDDIERIKPTKKVNLSKNERDALKELADDDEIIIKPADKGGGLSF